MLDTELMILDQANKPKYINNELKEGFGKPGILFVFNAREKIKPQHSKSIRGFYFFDKAEDGQNNGFAKPADRWAKREYKD